MKILLIILTAVCISTITLLLLDSQSELEKIPIQSMFFKKGDNLSVAVTSFEKAIQESGYDWCIVVDPRISEKLAKANFGGGGDANNFAYIISKTFNAKAVVFEKDRLILYREK